MGEDHERPPPDAQAQSVPDTSPAPGLEPGDPGPIGTEPQFRGERPGDRAYRLAPQPTDPGPIRTKTVSEGDRGDGNA